MSATGYTIHVSGLAPETTEEKLHDFFSFCGKLLSVKKAGTEADITFEKQSAMRTSLMLNGGTLDGAHLEVTSNSSEAHDTKNVLPAHGSTPIGASPDFDQEDKPKAAIIAEYLAHGYVVGDHIIQKAIEVDQKQGISSRFLNFLSTFDKRAGERLVGENQTVSSKLQEQAHTLYGKARETDQQHGVSSRFSQYYEKALGTPVGQRVAQFYQDTSKEILDVHEEAKRIAAQKKSASQAPTPPNEAASAHAAGDAKAQSAASEAPGAAAAAPAATGAAIGEKSTPLV